MRCIGLSPREHTIVATAIKAVTRSGECPNQSGHRVTEKVVTMSYPVAMVLDRVDADDLGTFKPTNQPGLQSAAEA